MRLAAADCPISINSNFEKCILDSCEFKDNKVRVPFSPNIYGSEVTVFSEWIAVDDPQPLYDFLYRAMHLRLSPEHHIAIANRSSPGPFIRARPHLIKRLTEAFGSATYSDPGWSVIRKSSDPKGLHIEKGGVPLFLPSDEAPDHAALQDVINVDFPCTAPFRQPGFFVAHGLFGPNRASEIGRIYNNLKHETDCIALHDIWCACNDLGTPFSMKCIVDGDFEARSDCIVAYVPIDQRFTFAACIDRTLSLGKYERLDKLSYFVERFAPGIGIACERPEPQRPDEEPRTPKSFGQLCSEVLGERILENLR